MPNYKSVADYMQARSRHKAVQEAQDKLHSCQANVVRLRTIHSQLCKEYGDSGQIRQQLAHAEDELETLKEALKQLTI
jgi:transposase